MAKKEKGSLKREREIEIERERERERENVFLSGSPLNNEMTQ